MSRAHLIAAMNRRRRSSEPRTKSFYRQYASIDLLPAQRAAVREMYRGTEEAPGPWGPRGMIGFIGCGHGKTWICAMATAIYRAARPVMLVPHSVKRATELAIFHDSPVRFHPFLKIVTYESLSSKSGRNVIEFMAPDLLICDEAHKIGNVASGRTRRLMRYIANNPECRCVFVSGSLIDKKIRSWAHMAHAALRDWSPLPTDELALDHFCNVLDYDTEPAATDYAALAPLVADIPHPTRDDYKNAFFGLLTRTPGVVFSAGVSANVSLTLRAVNGPTPPIELEEGRLAIQRWQLPDGTELVDSLEYGRHERTMRLGFFSTWNISAQERPEWEPYFRARRQWARAVRYGLECGLGDTPGEIEDLAKAGDSTFTREWAEWVAQRTREPPRHTEWIKGAKDYVLEVAAGAEKHSVIWYSNQVVGDLLGSVGIPAYGAGSRAPEGNKTAALSYHVHGTGWNGQAYNQQLMIQWPSEVKAMEQLLSRMHRHGQENDVHADLFAPTIEAKDSLDHIAEVARHVAAIGGERHRILTGVWL